MRKKVTTEIHIFCKIVNASLDMIRFLVFIFYRNFIPYILGSYENQNYEDCLYTVFTKT